MLKIKTVIGARPQFIKAAVLSKSFAKIDANQSTLNHEIIHTGQHFDNKMSSIFFKELNIPEPKFNLNINCGTHGSNTGRMLEKIEEILIDDYPDMVVVFGDTDSTLAGALAASKLKIKVAHIEAGLRSFNRYQPEEQNRVLTDHLSYICFAPSDDSVLNLINEGISKNNIFRTGDILADAIRLFNTSDKETKELLKKYGIKEKNFILCTIHRPENTEEKVYLSNIFKQLQASSLPVIMPLHPRTKHCIEKFNLENLLTGLNVIEPIGYLEIISLQKKASLIITDSGGIQKEAYLQGTPCITVRKETEWIELVQKGYNILADPEKNDAILNSIDKQLQKKIDNFNNPLYGDGHASDQIVREIINSC
ncbi:MAG: UDP-N-acetylglucosamine 2-epimerase (non-hydrolyzing) [Prochlorococcus marinus CUG1435]|nr:UDP-N-acetylglucosamine 2-epimerase (non-hydrolyzing) [Prochlorococcus marinus CUG1435]